MAYNPIQFQQGMSLPEFLQSFGTEAGCAEAVRRARWPGGFVCPRCNSGAHCIVVSGRAGSSLKCDTAQPVRCRPNGNSLLARNAG